MTHVDEVMHLVADRVLLAYGTIKPLHALRYQMLYQDRYLYVRGVFNREATFFSSLHVGLSMPPEDKVWQHGTFLRTMTDADLDGTTIVFTILGELRPAPTDIWQALKLDFGSNTQYVTEYVRPGRWMAYLQGLDEKFMAERKSVLSKHRVEVNDEALFPDLPLPY